uniref:C2 domain-containing protein n=1 Tax=Chromera velia CCMP2878 TaxID=1169474 RepID=A0A0G4HKK2_9ALVE|eukprot:Cvel_28669.t1-p1 / transcript=Cvel_28669.t1 / gene=Cvel_28669 / organism=Chromera_velia_CCMP2878 / gene_product=hypothetical protein / transcript_product=hypothetical protein / location=Cvel_scaffold3797:3748-6271(+) / protein_length=366 / sequence_SO=supercontig / SO=protein_coding / is_pseudo=false
MGKLQVTILSATNISHGERRRASDTTVKLAWDDKVYCTREAKRSSNPVWNQKWVLGWNDPPPPKRSVSNQSDTEKTEGKAGESNHENASSSAASSSSPSSSPPRNPNTPPCPLIFELWDNPVFPHGFLGLGRKSSCIGQVVVMPEQVKAVAWPASALRLTGPCESCLHASFPVDTGGRLQLSFVLHGHTETMAADANAFSSASTSSSGSAASTGWASASFASSAAAPAATTELTEQIMRGTALPPTPPEISRAYRTSTLHALSSAVLYNPGGARASAHSSSRTAVSTAVPSAEGTEVGATFAPGGGEEVDELAVHELCLMLGSEEWAVRRALRDSGGDRQRAVNLLIGSRLWTEEQDKWTYNNHTP